MNQFITNESDFFDMKGDNFGTISDVDEEPVVKNKIQKTTEDEFDNSTTTEKPNRVEINEDSKI